MNSQDNSQLTNYLLSQISSLKTQIISLKEAHKHQKRTLEQTIVIHEENRLALIQRQQNTKRLYESIIESYKINEEIALKKSKNLEYLQKQISQLIEQNHQHIVTIQSLQEKLKHQIQQNSHITSEYHQMKTYCSLQTERQRVQLNIQQLETNNCLDLDSDERESESEDQQSENQGGPGSIVSLSQFLKYQSQH